MSQNTTTATAVTQVDPRTLLVDVNVRADLRLTKEFVGSIKTHGVLQPIVATQTDQGTRVRFGHRRTHAAIEAGLDTVPVILVGSENDADAESIERLLTQHAENEHRAGLTTGENVEVARQLSLLGLSPTQIAKRTHTKKADVDARLAVGASELAAKATDRYDLTLDQAAVIAEFEDDTETVKALVVAAKEGRFEHVAQVARDARGEAQAKAPVIAALTEQGVTVLDARPRHGEDAKVLEILRNDEGQDLDPIAHSECPGHAVYLTEVETYTEPDGTVLDVNRWGDVIEWPEGKEPADEDEAEQRLAAAVVTVEWVPEPACLNYSENGHLTSQEWYDKRRGDEPAAEKSEEQREAERVARRLVIEHNKAWKSAREVRNEWVKTYLTRKTPPASAGTFVAVAHTRDAHLLGESDANRIAAEWFSVEAATYGHSPALSVLAEEAGDKRAQVITLGLILAAYENRASDNAWRGNGEESSTGRYLRFLASLGYDQSEVEEYAASSQTV